MPAVAQDRDPRAAFLDALGRFSLALDGQYGDEAASLRLALDQAGQAAAAWDAAIGVYERGMATDLLHADARTAARLHLALATAYVDRLRARDALPHLDAALRLDPTLAQAALLRGLVHGHLLGAPQAAADAIQASLSIDPSGLVPAYLLAHFRREAGAGAGTDEAVRRFLDALDRARLPGDQPSAPFTRLGLVPENPRVEPFLPPARYVEGFRALQAGDLAGGLARLRDALAGDPLVRQAPEPGSPRAAAAAALRDGDGPRAAAQLEALVAQDPGNAEAHRLLGQALVLAGLTDRAREAFTRAIALDPTDERARLALSTTLMDEGEDAEAERVLRATMTASPGSGRARYRLGLVLQRQRQYAAAIDAFAATIPLGPLLGLNTVYRALGALSRDVQDLDGAVAAYSARVGLIPNDAAAHLELGDIYVLQGDDLRAHAEYRVSALLDPAKADAQTALGQSYLRQGQYQAAADAAARALRADASHREARYVSGAALIRLGQVAEGTRELETFQRLQEEDAALRVRRLEVSRLRREAQVLADGGDAAAAVDLLQQAVALAPGMPDSYLALGDALLAAGRPQDALAPLSRAAELGAPPDVYLRLATAYTALGSRADAERAQQTYGRARRGSLAAGSAR